MSLTMNGVRGRRGPKPLNYFGYQNIRDYGPGKFSDLIDQYPHAMTLDMSWVEEYEAEDGNMVALVWLPENATELAEELALLDVGITPNCDEQRWILAHKAAVVTEKDQGQVFIHWCRTAYDGLFVGFG